MNWLKTDEGLEIYYEVTGEGPAIVFQSGYMGIHDIWKYQIDYFKNSYKCITQDNRGYGLSSTPTSSSYYTMEKNADDLKAILDASNIITPIVLVTHSIGDMIATAFAEKYPELVKGIIMIGGPLLSGLSADKNGRNDEMFSAYQTTPSSRMQFYTNLGLCKELAMEASKWQHSAFTKQTRAMLNYRPKNNIEQPTIVVHSKSDPSIPQDLSEEIVNTLPKGKLLLLDGFKHFPQTEKPEIINTIISDFCNELNY